MKLKLWLIYTGVIGTGIICFIIMIFVAQSPEQTILGEWVEDSWEYERVNKIKGDSVSKKEISEEEKNLIAEGLIFHKAEIWRFMPYGKLKLLGNGTEKNVIWKLKGRGHILKMKYQNEKHEHYNISELTDTSLIINFEADIEARGIAKLTFKRKK